MTSKTYKVIVHDYVDNPEFNIVCPFEFAKYVHEKVAAKIPDGGTGALWFRGQADCTWLLIPSIGRKRDFYKTFNEAKKGDPSRLKDLERALLSRFRRDAYPYVQRVLAEWEAITLAQHHGLPTRLLDWTSNPFVGLYFAVEQLREKDGALFCYRPRSSWDFHISMFEGQNYRNPSIPRPLDISGIKVVFPILLANRLIAQSGGFTIQNPYRDLLEQCKLDKFNEREIDILEIYRWRIPKDKKESIANALHRCSVNHKTLFPDLGGLGNGMIRGESFRKGGGWQRTSTRKSNK